MNIRTGMHWSLGHVIGTTLFLGPAELAYLAGVYAGASEIGTIVAALWIVVYLYWNLGIVPQQQWKISERFGQYWDVKLPGLRLHCMLGFIDVIKQEGNFKDRSRKLFCGSSVPGGIEELDFQDGSAPVDATMWFHIGRSDATKEEFKEDVFNYVYRADTPDDQAVQIAEDHLRVELQKLNVDTASETRKEIASGVQDEISTDIAPLGLYLQKQAAILIADIDLPPAVRALREERMRGQTDADALAKEGVGYRKSIEAIMGSATEGEQSHFTFEHAVRLWENQQTRNMIAKTGSNITIVAASADGIVRALNVNQPKGV